MPEELKKTPLFDFHVRAGAKMAPFAGYSMPIQYSGIRQEHEAVRKGVGLFDVSHMGNFIVRGPGACAFLQRLTTNNVAGLRPGDVQYSSLCRPHGGVIDDILVYAWEPNLYMVVVNASNIDKDWAWFVEQKNGADCELENRSEALAILSLQGPKAEGVLRKITGSNLSKLLNYKGLQTGILGVETWLARTGYTGEDGFELFPESRDAMRVWETLVDAGASEGLLPIGLGARDTLRLESGYSLYGHELNETINPLEAGLGWITDFAKGNFIGREALWAIKQAGPKRKMTGIEMTDMAIPRDGFEVHYDGKPVGFVTSGTQSPTLGKGIALALVESACAERGTSLQVSVRGALKSGKAVPRAFYKRPKEA